MVRSWVCEVVDKKLQSPQLYLLFSKLKEYTAISAISFHRKVLILCEELYGNK